MVWVKTFVDGNIYEGEFFQDLMQGVGKMTYTNGDYYDGEWFENNRVSKGEGVLHLPDGSIYLGSFLDCLADGTGVMKYENGDVFEGLWRDDEKNGQGTYKYVSGDIFVGEFVDGHREGKGIYNCVNGDHYSGAWYRNRRHGLGHMKFAADHSDYNGEWKDDGINGFENLSTEMVTITKVCGTMLKKQELVMVRSHLLWVSTKENF